MYCGICVEVCPFDALFWSPHFEYSTDDLHELTHEMDTLGEWMKLVPSPPPLEVGSEDPVEMEKEDKVYGQPAAAAAPAPAAPAAPAAPEAPPAEAGPAPDSGTEAGAPEAETAAPPTAERHDDEPPQIDQETFDKAMGEGKTEREARALAKKAWVLKRRKERGG
jgi:NADH-quinone oxidoreductase subunit I